MPRPARRQREKRQATLRSRLVFFSGRDFFNHYKTEDGSLDYDLIRELWFQHREQILEAYARWNGPDPQDPRSSDPKMWRRKLPDDPSKPDPWPWAYYEFEQKPKRGGHR